MPKPKKTPAPETPRPLLSELPETVTITLKLHDKKYMALRQSIASGDIEGHKLAASYNLVSGGLIISIGDATYEGNIETNIQEMFDQIVAEKR
jgi:hypothetical protein